MARITSLAQVVRLMMGVNTFFILIPHSLELHRLGKLQIILMDHKAIVSLVVVVPLALMPVIKNVHPYRHLPAKKIELRLTGLFTLRRQ
jgi:hypothetical protein